jgi:hypothetical protein
VGYITVAMGWWHHVSDDSSTKSFGRKLLQHGDVSVQWFIYKGTTMAMGGCHHLPIANVIHISIALF